MGRPGMEMGAPGRPGFASRTWSWMTMLCAGSGVVTDGAEATTVIDWWTAASCRVVPHCALLNYFAVAVFRGFWWGLGGS